MSAEPRCGRGHIGLAEGRAHVVTDPAEQKRGVDAAYGDKYIDPLSGARASIFDPLDDLYRVDVIRVVSWMYGTVGGWTEWPYAPSGVDSRA